MGFKGEEKDIQYYKVNLIEIAIKNFEAQRKSLENISRQLDVLIILLTDEKYKEKKSLAKLEKNDAL
jgi:hypothetical protein